MKTKKELKAIYKEQKAVMGVFQIRNTVNDKRLIEASVDIPAKWNRHRTELRFGTHRNKVLQQDWNKDGAACFEFSILSELKVKETEQVNVREEVKILKEMVEEELNITAQLRY